jgi:hypothetical protein
MSEAICKYAKQYQGLRKPACNKGDPCELCTMKFRLQEVSRILDRPPFEFKGKGYAYVAELEAQLHILTFKAEKLTLISLENL